MAFNLATFKTRSLTAVVFVIVMLAGILMNQWSFFILFSVIHFGCWFEYQKLVMLIDVDYTRISLFHKFGVMIFGWCFMLYAAGQSTMYEPQMAEIGLWLGLAVLIGLVIEAFISKSSTKKYLAHSFFGLVYLSLSLALFVDLSWLAGETVIVEVPNYYNQLWSSLGWPLPGFVIACMWINDTMAYIVGSLIGKTPFSKISPKKTWEGTVGGIILCAVVAGFLAFRFMPPFYSFGIWTWMLIAGIAAIAGTLGDLLESKLKRLAMVKDSGQLMPGHGGFLDRFDSLLLAAPAVWLLIKLLTYF
jgi:phosphatidate cytidylyltransferase